MASEVRFYHLQTSSLEEALPVLLQKSLQSGRRVVVRTKSIERTDHLNQHLWTYDAGSFLPHGSAKEGDAENQPVWLTEAEENPNSAQILFLLDGAECQNPDAFNLICTVFDGRDEELLATARAQWKAWGTHDSITRTYWQQTETGWEKKA